MNKPKILTDLYSKMNYNTIRSLEKWLPITAHSANLMALFLAFNSIDPALSISAFAAAIAGNTASLIFSCTSAEEYAKDYQATKKLYNEFIQNYNKQMQVLGISNPLEYFYLYCFALKSGYLSVDKKFEYNKNCNFAAKKLDGTVVLTGAAVCRNTASLLTDFAANYGYHAAALTCYTESNPLEIVLADEENKLPIKNLLDVADKYYPKDAAYIEYLMQLIYIYDNVGLIKHGKPGAKKFKPSNHVITYVWDATTNYFFDPTSYCTMCQSSVNPSILFDNDIRTTISGLYRGMGPSETEEMLTSKRSSIDEVENMRTLSKTFDMFNENTDILETFYEQNQELMKEILQASPKIRTKSKQNK